MRQPAQALPQGLRKFVHIEWVDASGPSRVGWHFVTEYDFDDTYLCWSAGWIIAESATHIFLASHFGNIAGDKENEQMHGNMAIPKKMIRRMKRVQGLVPK